MSEYGDTIVIDGIEVFRDGSSPSTYRYIPGAPVPERDARGRPTLSLWFANGAARLQLGARWELDEQQRTELRAALPRIDGSADQPDLQSVPLQVSQVVLELGDGTGGWQTLASTRSSGFSPFAAIFAVLLTAAQGQQVVAMLNGRTDFVRVCYRATRSLEVAARATIAGDVSDELDQLGPDPALDACRARIERAIEEQRLTLTVDGDRAATPELEQRAAELALLKAARALYGMARATPSGPPWRGMHETRLDAQARVSGTVLLPLERAVDLSAWWPDGGGAEHVRVLNAPLPEPRPPGDARSVRLGFDPTDSRIAFVELRHGEHRAVLRGPRFEAAGLPAGAEGPLEVTTHYTAAGAPYTTRLAAAGPAGWELLSADLGLQRITVDAGASHAAGAREVRVRARYRPGGDGADDDRTVYLRRDSWVASWYLITRAPDLAGTVEVEWKETAADGAVTIERWSTDSSTIARLS